MTRDEQIIRATLEAAAHYLERMFDQPTMASEIRSINPDSIEVPSPWVPDPGFLGHQDIKFVKSSGDYIYTRGRDGKKYYLQTPPLPEEKVQCSCCGETENLGINRLMASDERPVCSFCVMAWYDCAGTPEQIAEYSRKLRADPVWNKALCKTGEEKE